MRSRLLLITAAGAWCAMIVAAPVLAAGDGMFRLAGSVLYAFFSPVCHQWESHSFHLLGEKLPVCIRCTAIYFGFLAGILFSPTLGAWVSRRYTPRAVLIAAAAGMIADVVLSTLGIAPSSTVTRVLTGGIFGILSAFILTPLVHEFIESLSADAA